MTSCIRIHYIVILIIIKVIDSIDSLAKHKHDEVILLFLTVIYSMSACCT